jgi:hypothetical protein
MKLPAAAHPLVTARKPPARERTKPVQRARRVPYRVACRVQLVDPVSGEVRRVMGETLNISSGGVSLQIGVEAAIGTWAETLVLHPNGDPMFLCGSVVHCRRTMTANYEVGVETESSQTFV